MDGIHQPFEDEILEVTLKTNDSDSDADTVISALDRTIEDLDTTFKTNETLFDESATVPDDKEPEDSETEPTMAAEATFTQLADELEKKLSCYMTKMRNLMRSWIEYMTKLGKKTE